MPQPPNLGALLQQAQKMQEEMLAAQEKLKDELIEASAGGGMVKVTMTGDLELTLGQRGQALALAALLPTLLRRVGGVRDRGGPLLSHPLLAQALVLLVVLDARALVLGHCPLLS